MRFVSFLYLLSFLPTPVVAEVIELLTYNTYIVNHKAGESLLLDINKSTPVREKGSVFHGGTTYRIKWWIWLKEE